MQITLPLVRDNSHINAKSLLLHQTSKIFSFFCASNSTKLPPISNLSHVFGHIEREDGNFPILNTKHNLTIPPYTIIGELSFFDIEKTLLKFQIQRNLFNTSINSSNNKKLRFCGDLNRGCSIVNYKKCSGSYLDYGRCHSAISMINDNGSLLFLFTKRII